MNLLRGFLDNDSAFGRLMTRCWIIIACNVLFVLLTLPVVTIGPAWVAMDYVLLRTLRGDGDLNPLREFWKGFRMNFKQSFPCWSAILLFAGFLALEIYWCGQFGGVFLLFRLGLVMMLSAALILTLLLRDFMQYLPLVDQFGNILTDEEINVGSAEKSEAEILEEMRKIGM